MWKDFKAFIMRGNVVELAIAVTVGVAFTAVVKALVSDLLTPLISIPAKTNFEALKTTIGHGTFLYGDFLNVLLAFLSVAIVLFFLVVRPLEALGRLQKRRSGNVEPETKDCPECCSTIPFKARRSAYCTTELESEAAA